MRPELSFEEFNDKIADAWDASDKDDILDVIKSDSFSESELVNIMTIFS